MSEAGGQAHFRAMRKRAAEHPSEKIGEEIRKLYSWSDEDKLIRSRSTVSYIYDEILYESDKQSEI